MAFQDGTKECPIELSDDKTSQSSTCEAVATHGNTGEQPPIKKRAIWGDVIPEMFQVTIVTEHGRNVEFCMVPHNSQTEPTSILGQFQEKSCESIDFKVLKEYREERGRNEVIRHWVRVIRSHAVCVNQTYNKCFSVKTKIYVELLSLEEDSITVTSMIPTSINARKYSGTAPPKEIVAFIDVFPYNCQRSTFGLCYKNSISPYYQDVFCSLKTKDTRGFFIWSDADYHQYFHEGIEMVIVEFQPSKRRVTVKKKRILTVVGVGEVLRTMYENMIPLNQVINCAQITTIVVFKHDSMGGKIQSILE